MIKYVCDVCGKQSDEEDDIPKYTMFVCDNYDGDDVMLCRDCEQKVKAALKWRGQDGN